MHIIDLIYHAFIYKERILVSTTSGSGAFYQ